MNEPVPSGEVRDTEMADAISTIKQVRHRMHATDKRDARLERCDFMISFSLVSMRMGRHDGPADWFIRIFALRVGDVSYHWTRRTFFQKCLLRTTAASLRDHGSVTTIPEGVVDNSAIAVSDSDTLTFHCRD